MTRRLRSSKQAESAMNAIIILSAYSSVIPAIVDKEVRLLRNLFIR